MITFLIYYYYYLFSTLWCSRTPPKQFFKFAKVAVLGPIFTAIQSLSFASCFALISQLFGICCSGPVSSQYLTSMRWTYQRKGCIAC